MSYQGDSFTFYIIAILPEAFASLADQLPATRGMRRAILRLTP